MLPFISVVGLWHKTQCGFYQYVGISLVLAQSAVGYEVMHSLVMEITISCVRFGVTPVSTLFQFGQDCCRPTMNSSNIANSSDIVDYSTIIAAKMEFNCSQYEFHKEPPNVTQHFDALGVVGLGFAYGGTASSGLLTLVFLIHICCNVRKCPWEWQRPLTWIISMPMIISWLSLTSFLVPRAGNLCGIVKQSYMPFMLMHFLDLALMIDGDEERVLDTLMDNRVPMSLCAAPCCCFGLCCGSSVVTKRGFRALRRRVYQAPLWQFLLTMAAVVLEIAEINQILPEYIVTPIFQCLAGLNVLMYMLGSWGFNVIVKTFKGLERSMWNRRMKKAHALTLFIAAMKIQIFILGLLVDYSDYIPCSPPAVSPVHMKQSIDAVLSLIEALIFGIVFAFVFRVRLSDIERAMKGDGTERSPNFYLVQNMQYPTQAYNTQ